MNIGYIRLSDGTIAVTDENGIIDKRNQDVSTNALLIENKIEVVDNNISQIKEEVKKSKDMVVNAGWMLKILPISFILGVVVEVLFNGVFANVLYNAIGAFVIFYVPSNVMFGLARFISKRKLKKYESRLEKVEELKTKYEKELEQELALEKREVNMNEPISLVEQNNIELPLVEDQLENAYSDAMHSKQKKLILGFQANRRR